MARLLRETAVPIDTSIVALRIGDEACVLGRVEEALAIALAEFEPASQEVAEHGATT